jgi:hypothetical protein
MLTIAGKKPGGRRDRSRGEIFLLPPSYGAGAGIYALTALDPAVNPQDSNPCQGGGHLYWAAHMCCTSSFPVGPWQ